MDYDALVVLVMVWYAVMVRWRYSFFAAGVGPAGEGGFVAFILGREGV